MNQERFPYTPTFEIEGDGGLREEILAETASTRELILRSLADGRLETFARTSNSAALAVEVTLKYFFDHEKSTVQLGLEEGRTTEGISYLIRTVFRHLWFTETQGFVKNRKFKDLKIQRENREALNRFKWFEQEVTSFQSEGLSPEEILAELGLTDKQLSAIRDQARKKGIEIPTLFALSKFDTHKLRDRLVTSTDDEEIQKLFDQVKHSFYKKYARGRHPLLKPLQTVLREILPDCMGSTSDIARKLKHFGVPVGVVNTDVPSGKQKGVHTYHFILTRHKQRTLDIIRKNFDVFVEYATPIVKLVSGDPEERIPNSTDLQSGNGYERLGKFLQTFGIRIKGNYKRVVPEDFFKQDNCRVPIYRCGKAIYFPVSRKAELEAYVRKIQEKK